MGDAEEIRQAREEDEETIPWEQVKADLGLGDYMYQVDLRRKAAKDLSDVPKEYARLVAWHIDGLSEDTTPA